VLALTTEPTARELVPLYDRPGPFGEPEIADAARLIELAGARERTEMEAQRQLDLALRCLESVGPPPESVADLTALAELMTRRDR
jgi:geranylgeranyl diphosphate synthase, type I